jgi:uncharacterized protein (DUF1015 family)
MAELRAFRPLRYNPSVIPDLARVVAPPYDVISTARRDALYARDEYNVVRLILNRESDPYAQAAALLRAWRRDGVLVREPHAVVCFYVEEFPLPDGSAHHRSGVIGVVRLQSFASGRIRPHEQTFRSAKEDRMRLLQACRANLSPIFGLFAGAPTLLQVAHAAAATRPADLALHDDTGGRHQLWLLQEPQVIASIAAALADEPVYIADGHHRYETALAYSEQQRAAGNTDPDAPHNFVLMYLTSMHDPGLVILPTHRVVSGALDVDPGTVVARMRAHFRLRAFPRSAHAALRAAVRAEPRRPRFGVALAGTEESFLAELDDPASVAPYVRGLDPTVRSLDVAIIDTVILHGLLGLDCTAAAQSGQLTYTHDDDTALQAVEQGARAAFLVNPPRIADLLAVCRAGQTMPQKSTYFYPKLLTGLVFHPLEGDDAAALPA